MSRSGCSSPRTRKDCSFDCVRYGANVFVFPCPDHLPPGRIERYDSRFIAFDVPAELRDPVVLVALGRDVMVRAAVPEAAIDEDHDTSASEDDVRLDPNSVAADEQVLSEAQPSTVKLRPERLLRSGACATVATSDAARRFVLRLWVRHSEASSEGDRSR